MLMTHWFMRMFITKRVVRASHKQEERNKAKRPHTDQVGMRNVVIFQAFPHIHFKLFILPFNLLFAALY